MSTSEGFDSLFEVARGEVALQKPWMSEKQMILGTRDNLETCIQECIDSGLYALDLETTGVDNRVFNGRTKDHIVGVCLSPDGVKGYYIPLRHKQGEQHNVPFSLVYPALRRLLASNSISIFHNGKFDQEFLEFPGEAPLGEFDKPAQWHDTLILAYLRNSRVRNKRLKYLVKTEFGVEMIELQELFDTNKGDGGRYRGDLDFSLLSPLDVGVVEYGCGDAIWTYNLFKKLAPEVLEPDKWGFHQKRIYAIEKACLPATRWMERNRIPIDRNRVGELLVLGQTEMISSLKDVYESASTILRRPIQPTYFNILNERLVLDDPNNLVIDQIELSKEQAARQNPSESSATITKGSKTFPLVYDVDSPEQIGNMLDEMGVPGLKRTENSGQIQTSKEELSRIAEENKTRFPFVTKIKRYRETRKALSSYLIPLYRDIEPSDHTARINFQGHKVDTGRFSTPSKEKNEGAAEAAIKGWPEFNLQSLPASYDQDRPECLLRIRETIVPHKGEPGEPPYFVLAIDASGEELRLVTNLSGEPKWITEFFRCADCSKTFDRGDGSETPTAPPPYCPVCNSDKIGDLHTLTGLSVFGSDAKSTPKWKKLRGDAKKMNFALCYGGGGSAVVRATGCDANEGFRRKKAFDKTYTGLTRWWDAQHKYVRERLYIVTPFGRKYPIPDAASQDSGFRAKADRNAVNGPIQGAGGDIIKLAMALIYKELKKRGWLEFVRLFITMHDELVFSVRADYLEPAIELINQCFVNNAVIREKRWPVPLTTDTEIGKTWAVEWNLNEMLFKKGCGFPPELLPYFKNARPEPEEGRPPGPTLAPATTAAENISVQVVGEEKPIGEFGLDAKPSAENASAQVVAEQSVEEPDAPKPPATNPPLNERPVTEVVDLAPTAESVLAPTQVAPSSLAAKGPVYEFRLRAPLTPYTMMRLAEVLSKCLGVGGQVLRLYAADGTCLDEWSKTYTGGKALCVTATQFYWLAKERGL